MIKLFKWLTIAVAIWLLMLFALFLIIGATKLIVQILGG